MIGTGNDLKHPDMGRCEARFGRNMPLSEVWPRRHRDPVNGNRGAAQDGAEQGKLFEKATSMIDVLYTFGTAHPGAITLHNYPRFMQDLEVPAIPGKRSVDHIDLAAVVIMRDRERGVPRYNRFRRLVHMPPAKDFSDITSNPVWQQELRDVYENDIECVDLMVGMFAEDLPAGFGFSDTRN